jgi:hypothetical protein
LAVRLDHHDNVVIAVVSLFEETNGQRHAQFSRQSIDIPGRFIVGASLRRSEMLNLLFGAEIRSLEQRLQ